MPTSDPSDILLQHDLWATLNVLRACEGLSEHQLHERFEIGPGSLHDTLTHMLGAIRAWTDVLAKRDLRPRAEGKRFTVAELTAGYQEANADLATQVAARPLDEVVTRVRDGKEYRFTRGAILAHVTTHGMHHRAQCLNMLRKLGVTPLPKSSVAEWTLEGDPAR
jgi:uncharacterized damage-inducible protein DinB